MILKFSQIKNTRYYIAILLALFTSSLHAQAVSLNVPYYEQGKDSIWADEILGNKSTVTIRTYGCTLTCISMVASHFSDFEYTPSQMNKWLQNNNGFQDGWEGDLYLGEVNLNWPALSQFENGFVYTRHDWQAQPADLVLIRYYLDKQIPVIAEVLYNGLPHYVVLTGYNEKEFLMNDPEFPDKHNLSDVYNISDKWGSGPSRNIYGIRVLYPPQG